MLVNDGEFSSHLSGDSSAAATPQALIDRGELTFIAVERTRMPMVVSDPRQNDNPIIMANAAFLKVEGYAVDEVVGRNGRFRQGEIIAPLPSTKLAKRSSMSAFPRGSC